MRWTFDLECSEWTKLVCAVAMNERREIKIFRTPRQVCDWYRSTSSGDLILSHYGGGYDFLFLIHHLKDLSWTARMSGSLIASCRAKGHGECRDTMKLFPGSLADWTGKKEELGSEFPCVCEDDCGGYCSITTKLPKQKLDRLIEYNVNDCEILNNQWEADLARLEAEGFAIYDDFGRPRLTVGALAWHTAAPMAGLDPKEPEDFDDYDVGVRCGFGGHTEVGAVGSGMPKWEGRFGTWYARGVPLDREIKRYDANSMYPWALRQPVPVGSRTSLRGSSAMRAYIRDRPGAYYARVHLPESEIASLPHRYREPESRGCLYQDRLVWACGFIESWWTGLELANAEAYGARILEITAAEVYTREEPIYRGFIDHIYGLRVKAKKAGDDRWAGRLKWIANSLTGKLAQSPEQSSIKIVAEGEEPPTIRNHKRVRSPMPRVSKTDPTQADWRWLGGNVWASPPYRRVPACARTIHNATLTARARVSLFERLHEHIGHWIYCDTDSTYIDRADNRNTSDHKLGAYKLEGIAKHWEAIGPKAYRYWCPGCKECRKTSGWHVRIKGIPRARHATFDRYRSGQPVGSRVGVDKLRSSDGEFRRRNLIRTSRSDLARAGTRIVLPNGRTRPLWRSKNGSYS